MRNIIGLMGGLALLSCGGDDDGRGGRPAPTDTDLPATDTDTDTDQPTTDTDTTELTSITSDSGSTLVGSGQVVCADPSPREAAPFVRTTRGTPPNDSREWPGLCPYQFDPASTFADAASNSCVWIWAGGFIAADLDDDGFVDLISPNESERATVYMGNAAGSFTESFLDQVDLSHGVGGVAGDYDGDGDLDVYVARYAKPNVLLRNDGGVLTDVTMAAGDVTCKVPDTHHEGELKDSITMSTSFADYDHDGDLDLFVGNYGFVDHALAEEERAAVFGPAEPSCLYRNNGDGTFTDITSQLIPPGDTPYWKFHDGYTYAGGFFDFDNDMWPELYSVNDFGSTGYTNTVLWNEGGAFVPEPPEATGSPDVDITGMGLAVADLNGDLFPDMVMPYWNGIMVLQSLVANEQPPRWYRVPGNLGMEHDLSRGQKVGWGARAADLDNDARIDVLVAFGYMDDGDVSTWDNALRQPDAAYMQQPDGSFVDMGEQLHVADDGVGRGFVVEDFDNDGWLDVAKRDLLGPNVFYKASCGKASWVRVQLRAPSGNTRGVGARVEATNGGVTQVRWLHAGGDSHASGHSPEAHFGLGEAESVEHLRVTWPDGRVDDFDDVPARQILTITRQ